MTRRIARLVRHLWWRVADPRRIAEVRGERVVFTQLRASGFLEGLRDKRILEIGPKHGQDSFLLTSLRPRELVLIDLPEKRSLVSEWLPQLSSICNTRYLEGNLLYMPQEQLEQVGAFDLVWCLGVLYHNAEQLRLIRRLFHLCSLNGRVVVESATTRNALLAGLNIVEIHWPSTYRNVQTITHLPSRRAVKSWMEMAGFTDVKIWNIYSRALGWQRGVLTGIRTLDSAPYLSHRASGLNPSYAAGDSSSDEAEQ